MFVLNGGSPDFVPIIVWAASCRRASSIFSRHEEEFKKKPSESYTTLINYQIGRLALNPKVPKDK